MKNKIYAVILVCIVMLSTGCGSKDYLKNDKKAIVTYEKTGQNVQKNILCQPEDKELLEIYKKYDKQMKISVDKLPKCDKFKVNSGEYKSLWDSLFVKPLAFLILKLGKLIKNYGTSVMLVGLLIRILLLPFSIKTVRQSENMKKANPELQRLEQKYKDKTDQESMMAKSQEMMMIYKKYNISPLGSCLLAFLQLPLFFGFLQAINRVPAIFEDSFLGLKLGMTPFKGIDNHQYTYIILIVLIIFTTYYSFKDTMKQNNGGNPEAQKQMNMTMYFMIIMISFASFSLPTAIALYWIVTNGFIIVQNKVIKKLIASEDTKDKLIKPTQNKKNTKDTKVTKAKVSKKRG